MNRLGAAASFFSAPVHLLVRRLLLAQIGQTHKLSCHVRHYRHVLGGRRRIFILALPLVGAIVISH